jgi:crotonobetainyl-CoA:carnitine CoA-transferase CaiB-like acyl-CoA transferase
MNQSALNGVRIADFGWVLAGPYSSMLLSYLGAEVIKIETRKRIDEQRVQHGAGASKDCESSSNFFEINLNKLSVTLDLSTAKGSELAKKIVSISDVAMENMRPGVLNKLGLGYSELVKVKPDIIMLSLSGYGATGPLSGYAAYAPCFSSFGGQAFLTGYADGEPNTMTSDCDARAGTMAAFAVLMALNIRQRTGQGQHIDLSSSEALNAMIGDQMMEYSMNQRSPSRDGNHDAIMAPHNCYRCRGNDAWISIAVATDKEWESLCDAMGNPEWTRDEAFSNAYSRWQNQERLDRLIQEWTKNYRHHEVMDLLQGGGVAAMPSFKAKDLFTNPHLISREAIAEIKHPVLGTRKAITPPWKMSETPPRIVRTAPLLGEHNEYVFCELLGMPKEEVTQLMEEKVIY